MPILELKVRKCQAPKVSRSIPTLRLMSDDTIQAFARRLREICEDKGLPTERGLQTRLAREFKVSPNAARKWLLAEGMPELDRLQDPALKKLRDGAIVADLVETATREQMQTRIRVQALERLQRDYPAEFAGREALLARLEKRRLAEVSAEKRKEGVTLGMTQEEVLASSWGKPRKINRSTYTFGTREQWVYDGGYLYFRDGILDSIQN